MTERRMRGRPASPGFAAGPVFVLAPTEDAAREPTGDPAREATALHDAVAAALAETLALQAVGDAADMIAFQAAMLEDTELLRPAAEAVSAGMAADVAWDMAMAAEIAGYASAEDPYFRARTADLQDIRDRVVSKLRPNSMTTDIPAGSIVVSADLPLSRFLAIDWTQGGAIVLTEGSPSSHVAMLARAGGVPMIVGIGGPVAALAGTDALVDAVAGEIVIDPLSDSKTQFATRRQQAASSIDETHPEGRAYTIDGTEIRIYLNIVGIAELKRLNPAICDGIGLFRTEFLFQGKALPNEDEQYGVYRSVAEWAQGRTVTIRTLDAGGDKPIPGITEPRESNPFLGLRGLRLSLRHPELLRIQLRALLRAARHGAVQIMLPMVTVPAELAAARALLDAESVALAPNVAPPPLGIMVEVPAAAIAIDRFDAAFFSIGSNDLTQYVTAAGRDMASVADLADPLNPAVLRLIEAVVRHGRETGRDVSLCGDAGGDPAVLPALLATGLRSVSVSPGLLAGTKRAVAAVYLTAPQR